MGNVNTEFYTFATADNPFTLSHGAVLEDAKIAFQTYGELSEKKDNAILIFHALTGSQHLAGNNPSVEGVEDLWTAECQTGWWDEFVGPKKAVDTERFFVVCANYLGGCYGSTGPRSIDPKTGKPYGGDFPSVTLTDMVDSQALLLEHLGVERLHAMIGASYGGLLAKVFAARYPERANIVITISSGSRTTSLTKLHNFEQICAIEQDPNFKGGNYYDGPSPDDGLSLARMIAHKNYVSLNQLKNRARGEVVQPQDGLAFYKCKFPLESYMKHAGAKFVKRFDANTYLRIIDAWQSFDLERDIGTESLSGAYEKCRHQKHMVFSVDSDVCFYPEEQADFVYFLKRNQVPCRHMTMHSDKGHDAFLLEPELFGPQIAFCLQQGW